MFVNGHVFLVTKSFNIKFRSVMNIQEHGTTELENGLKKTIPYFIAHKFNIETIVGDTKFESVRK